MIDQVEMALVTGMLCLMAETLLVGFSRPLWRMLHPRRFDGRRDLPPHYEWRLRAPGILLLLAAVCVIAMSVTNTLAFG